MQTPDETFLICSYMFFNMHFKHTEHNKRLRAYETIKTNFPFHFIFSLYIDIVSHNMEIYKKTLSAGSIKYVPKFDKLQLTQCKKSKTKIIRKVATVLHCNLKLPDVLTKSAMHR